MGHINYDNKRFRSIENSLEGEAGTDTIFEYHQSGDIVWAEYSGGRVVRGHLIATCDRNGSLDMRYHHINSDGKLMTGVCRSTPETLSDGRIRLYEEWQWTCGDMSSGSSILEEISNLG